MLVRRCRVDLQLNSVNSKPFETYFFLHVTPMASWRTKAAFLLDFVAIVLVSLAVLRSHDVQIRGRDAFQDVEKEVDEMLSDLHTGRIMTAIALVLAVMSFLLEGYEHFVT